MEPDAFRASGAALPLPWEHLPAAWPSPIWSARRLSAPSRCSCPPGFSAGFLSRDSITGERTRVTSIASRYWPPPPFGSSGAVEGNNSHRTSAWTASAIATLLKSAMRFSGCGCGQASACVNFRLARSGKASARDGFHRRGSAREFQTAEAGQDAGMRRSRRTASGLDAVASHLALTPCLIVMLYHHNDIVYQSGAIEMVGRKVRVAALGGGSVGHRVGRGGARRRPCFPKSSITAPSPIVRRAPRAQRLRRQPAANEAPQAGTLPIVTDQFATVTVVPNDEIRRNGAGTLGDLLFSKPGITGSSFAPGASSRPIIRGLDVNRVRIQEDGIGANGASDLGEDHFVPVDPLIANQVEVIRGPATLRFGSQAIGGVVETRQQPHSRSDSAARGVSAEFRRCRDRASINGLDGAVLLDAGGGNFAIHLDAYDRTAGDYRVPRYPYLVPPDPGTAPRATQPGAFNGRQPNSALHADGFSIGGSYIFSDGFVGVAVTQNNALYHIPGIDGEDHNTRIDAHQTKVLTKGEWRSPFSFIDAIRFWGGATDYKHNEIGLGGRHQSRQRRRPADLHQQGAGSARRGAAHADESALRARSPPRSACRADTRSSPRRAPTIRACGTRTATRASPATYSTSSSSAKRPRRSSPAASNMSTCRAPRAFIPVRRRRGHVHAGGGQFRAEERELRPDPEFRLGPRRQPDAATRGARAETGGTLLRRRPRRDRDLRQGQSQSPDRNRRVDRGRVAARHRARSASRPPPITPASRASSSGGSPATPATAIPASADPASAT